jgi:hypothetical protein
MNVPKRQKVNMAQERKKIRGNKRESVKAVGTMLVAIPTPFSGDNQFEPSSDTGFRPCLLSWLGCEA